MKIFQSIFLITLFFAGQIASAQDRYVSSEVQIKSHFENFSKSFGPHLSSDPGKLVFTNKNKIERRMEEISLTVPFFSDDKVESWVQYFAVEEKENFQILLSVFEIYEEVFIEKLKKYSLPEELKYFPFVLSALNKTAVSENGRAGLWQIPYLRGRLQGMLINEYVDERRLVETSTEYALRHLKVLSNKYSDWHFALSEYVSGPAAVHKAVMQLSEGELIYKYLPEESLDYLPAYMAVLYLIHNQKQHKIETAESIIQVETASLTLKRKVHAEAISKVVSLDKKDVLNLNPVYRTDYLVPQGRFDKLLLPRVLAEKVSSRWDTIYFLTDSIINPSVKKIEIPKASYVYNHPVTDPSPPENTKKIIHHVKKGEVLGFIAEKYGVGLSRVKKWNNLRSSRIYIGQKLKIYVPKGQAAKYKNTGPTKSQALKPGEYTIYTVKQGDSLWGISRNYSGVSPEDIMRWNGIGTSLQPGQKLKIKK